MATRVELEFVQRDEPVHVKLDVDRIPWGDYERLVDLVGQENPDGDSVKAMMAIVRKAVVDSDVSALPARAVPKIIQAIFREIQGQEEAQKN